MKDRYNTTDRTHDHVFLGASHEKNERKTWSVIALCGAMMVIEIVGGSMFGSLALVADGWHMSTHAGAMLIAALAYTYARRHATDPRFGFGTGKLGDLAGFTSAIVLAMIALLIGYEAVERLLSPVAIRFAEAIPIASIGLAVNIVSAWLLSGDHHGHSHGHHHGHGDETCTLHTKSGQAVLSIHEDGVPPRFRLTFDGEKPTPSSMSIETLRPNGASQRFSVADRGGYLESIDEIPEPHTFVVRLQWPREEHVLRFAEHELPHEHHTGSHHAHRDNNIRSAYLHVLADAAVSVLAIAGLILAQTFGWLWMDPVAGLVGAAVIVNWSWTLMRDTAGILLDVVPDAHLQQSIRQTIEEDGSRLTDLHLWRLGPGHLGVMFSVETSSRQTPDTYRAKLARFPMLSHITVEIHPLGHA